MDRVLNERGSASDAKRRLVLEAARQVGVKRILVYGVYLGAAGWDLSEILSSADAYGEARSVYPSKTAMGKNYPHIPQSNLNNITRGFNDQKMGNLCTAR